MQSNINIITGKYKGMKIPIKKDNITRPTSQRVKESVFNILSDRINNFSDKTVLDLFCGTGSYGLESASRMAKEITFIDSDKNCINNLKNFCNIKKILNVKFQCKQIPYQIPYDHDEKYDLIFLDPPYSQINLLFDTIDFINKYFPESIMIIEHDINVNINYDHILRRELTKKTAVSFLFR